MNDKLQEDFFCVIDKIIDLSRGKLIIKNEKQKKERYIKNKNNETIGRSIETYLVMAKMWGWTRTFSFFYQEVVIPIKAVDKKCYQAAKKIIHDLGDKLCPPDFLDNWKDFYKT